VFTFITVQEMGCILSFLLYSVVMRYVEWEFFSKSYFYCSRTVDFQCWCSSAAAGDHILAILLNVAYKIECSHYPELLT